MTGCALQMTSRCVPWIADTHLTWLRLRSVEGRNAKGNTPFSIACAKGHLEIVRHLASLPSMIDCNTRNVNGATPALSACEAGYVLGDRCVALLCA